MSVRACVETGIDNHETPSRFSKPLRREHPLNWGVGRNADSREDAFGFFGCPNLFYPEWRFCVLAPTSRRDRDCVGLLLRCCARTKDSPTQRRKTNCIEWFSRIINRVDRSVAALLDPVTYRGISRLVRSGFLLNRSVQGFSFSFDSFFCPNSLKRGFGGFFLNFTFPFTYTLSLEQYMYRAGTEYTLPRINYE